MKKILQVNFTIKARTPELVCRHGSPRLRIPVQIDKRFQDKLTERKFSGGTGDLDRRKGEDGETNLYSRRLIHGFIQ
jgi:hypothetical protein